MNTLEEFNQQCEHIASFHNLLYDFAIIQIYKHKRGGRGRDCMVVGLTTTYAISAYHH